MEGWLEDLPPLNVGRSRHGCGGYVSDGDMVSVSTVIVNIMVMSSRQVLLVTGGWDYTHYLDTTELLVPGSGSWRLAAGLLPRSMCCMSVATVANTLYLTGTIAI